MTRTAIATALAVSLWTGPAAAQLVPDADDPLATYPAPAYSPYAGRDFPERPLWGEMHLHTELSMDAGGFGNRVSPRDAYRAARGEEIIDGSWSYPDVEPAS